MAVFLNQQQIVDSAQSIADTMRQSPAGNAFDADENWLASLDAIRCILDIDEAQEDAKRQVCNIIKEMEAYQGLGIHINGSFSPISPSVAARFDIKPGSFVSGNRFLVIREGDVERDFELHEDAEWDIETDSIIHRRYYMLRFPEEMMNLDDETIRSLNLEEAVLDHQIQQE